MIQSLLQTVLEKHQLSQGPPPAGMSLGNFLYKNGAVMIVLRQRVAVGFLSRQGVVMDDKGRTIGAVESKDVFKFRSIQSANAINCLTVGGTEKSTNGKKGTA